MEPSIFIRRPSIKVNVDRVVGHHSEGFAQSDGDDFIMERAADVGHTEIPLETDELSCFLLTFDRFVKKLNEFEGSLKFLVILCFLESNSTAIEA